MTAWIDDIRRQRDELPAGPGRIRAVVERVVDVYTGPLFRAALELWVAAASDPQLRQQIAPFERRIGREAHRVAVELLGADESEPGVREAIQATLDLARGLGLATLLSDDRRRREASSPTGSPPSNPPFPIRVFRDDGVFRDDTPRTKHSVSSKHSDGKASTLRRRGRPWRRRSPRWRRGCRRRRRCA